MSWTWHLALTLQVVSSQMGALIVFRYQKAVAVSWERELGPGDHLEDTCPVLFYKFPAGQKPRLKT